MTDYEDRRKQDRQDDQELGRALADSGVELQVSPEWRVVLGLLRGSWPGTLGEAERLAYITVLNDLPPRDVARAVRDLCRRGWKWRPTPGEVRATMNATDVDPGAAPTWDEAWQLVVAAGRETSYRPARALEVLAEDSLPVAAWARGRGLTHLWQLPTEDPDYGRHVLRDLERSWQAFVDAWAIPARRAQLAAPRGTGGLRRLQAPGAQLPPAAP